MRLAVCNLIAGTCDVLPPLQCGFSFGINSCAVLTFADGCCSDGERRSSPLPSYSAFFKVLVLVSDRDARNYSLCTFSSTELNWSTPIECFGSAELGGGAVVRQGTANLLVTDTLKRRGRRLLLGRNPDFTKRP